MSTSLIQLGILVCLAGTAGSGILAFWFRTGTLKSIPHIVLALANVIGFVVAMAFVQSGAPMLEIGGSIFGYELRLNLDLLSTIFFSIVTGISALCAVYAITYVERHKNEYHLPSLALATGLFIFGMQAVLLTRNIAGFMVFWEVMSIASFFLVMADRKQLSIKAALLYLVMTHLGAGAILAGFFVLTNGLLLIDFASLPTTAAALPLSSIAIALVLFLFGFGSKAGLIPLHVWLPEAHPQAPSHISALMSGVMLKIAFYGFLRVVLMFPVLPTWFSIMVFVLGILSAIFGALYAIIETDIKRTLAFSSIENIGLIFAMLGVGMFAFTQGELLLGELSIVAALFHSIMHAIFKSGLFLTAGAIISEIHDRSLEKMGGLAKRMPQLTGAFLVLALAAAALPPFGAFYGEWLFVQNMLFALGSAAENPLLLGALHAGIVGVAFVGGLAIFAMVKLFAIASLGEPRSEHASHAKDPSSTMLFPILTLAGLMVFFGVFASRVFSYLKAEFLIDPSTFVPSVTIPLGGPSITPALVFLFLVIGLLLAFTIRRLFSDVTHERAYHTWDCGQPINASMEYTATAFTAPIRFFFRMILRAKKVVIATPVLETNRWIATRTMHLEVRPLFLDYLYRPIERSLLWGSKTVRRIQNGSIQLYLALIFVALILSLIFAL